ncbi:MULTISPECIES: murein hydrolase activator EnvC [unclassified Nocardia]|uniref:murein hydrolase activator EnvC family protein n=1 Tax=unclassified Nocardia TaxID=2637762 RepID=UPI001CE4B0FD|nr:MULTISPECIES: M23 family metallopeptidase [unclassified Nocardia]
MKGTTIKGVGRAVVTAGAVLALTICIPANAGAVPGAFESDTHLSEPAPPVAEPIDAQSGSLIRPVDGEVVSQFGKRDLGTPSPVIHSGVDFAAQEGAPVYAAGDGKVEEVHAEAVGNGYGNYLIIGHGASADGALSTLYAHASGIVVRQGETVRAGQLVAYVGHTGFTAGTKLHFEVRVDGEPRDPMPYFR